jgi:acyl-CoA reductase-like NAD-dependent aldehyde dehydrogenase
LNHNHVEALRQTGRLLISEPASQAAIDEVPVAQKADVQCAVAAAAAIQPSWASKSATERARLLVRWRKILIDEGDSIAQIISRENGKPLHEAWSHELVPLCASITWLADESPKLLSERTVRLRWMKQYRSQIYSKPRGLCAIISPYNFPLLIPFADAAAALAAGCAVIIKPSEHTPLTALAVAKLAHHAGIDPGLLRVLPGGPEVAQTLLEAGIDEVVFTGSREHGREVARRCADQLVPCTLELGGKASLIVLEDVNLDSAASAIVFGALANSGQSCIAVERVIVPRRVQSRLVSAIVDRVSTLRQGDPLRAEVDLGALTSWRQMEHVQSQVDASVSQGARLVWGGHRGNSTGHFYLPTVLDECTPDMCIVRDETFGPAIPIVPVDTVEMALGIANAGAAGLAAYLFGRDEDRLRIIARQMHAGHVLLNDVLWSYVCPEIPFGGQHQSGWGVVHGAAGLRTHTRDVHVGTSRFALPQSFSFGFPYSRRTRQILKKALRLVIH